MRKFLLCFFALCIFFYTTKPTFASETTINVYVFGVIDPQVANFNETVNKIKNLNAQASTALVTSSTYKGYENNNEGYLNFNFVGEKYLQESVLLNTTQPYIGKYYPNYTYYLNEVNICNLVDSFGVNQVWFWTHHSENMNVAESNMSMGSNISEFWNRVDYGDVSNSPRFNDLPICKNTYTLFNYNFTRDLPEMLENQTHHLEHLFNFVDGRDTASPQNWDELLFWGNFVGSDASHKIVKPGCGWTHYPPNGIEDYDWYNKTQILSDCQNWDPNGGGTKKLVSCSTWSDTKGCLPDGGTSFKVWWMQNLPGKNNNLIYRDFPLTNWWDLYINFDSYLKIYGKSLVNTTPPEPTHPEGMYFLGENLFFSVKQRAGFENTNVGYCINKNINSKYCYDNYKKLEPGSIKIGTGSMKIFMRYYNNDGQTGKETTVKYLALGDVDQNGKLDYADVNLQIGSLLGYVPNSFIMDVDKNNKTNLIDVVKLLGVL